MHQAIQLAKRRQQARTAFAVLALLGAAACSSTQRAADDDGSSPVDSAVPAASSLPSGSAAPSASPGAAGSSAPGTTTGSGTSIGGASGATNTTGGAATGLGSTGGGSRFIPTGKGAPGVTDKTITVGLWTINAEAGNAAVGAVTGNASDDTTDYVKAAKSVVAFINARGGVAGRKLVAVLHEVNVANVITQSGRDQEMQSACEDWTKDHKVFAFMPTPGGNGLECARLANAAMLSDLGATGQIKLSESMFGKYKNNWYAPNGMTEDRRDRNYVDGLWRHGFLKPGVKVGVFVEDRQGMRDGYANAMLPALKRHGITPVKTIVYPDGLASSWSNYMLQMQRAGATHLLLSGSEIGAYGAYSAMTAAENQQYRPKWGYSTDLSPVELAGLQTNRNQLKNVFGIGWSPGLDTYSVASQSQGTADCLKIQRDTKQGLGVGTYCESLFFLKYALDRAAEVSIKGMSKALDKVSNKYPSVLTVQGQTGFADSRHDGAASYRYFVYDSRCDSSAHNCWKYTSPITAFGP